MHFRNQPHCNCTSKAFPNTVSVKSMPEEIQVQNESLSIHSRDHIFNVLCHLEVRNAANYVKHLPSAE